MVVFLVIEFFSCTGALVGLLADMVVTRMSDPARQLDADTHRWARLALLRMLVRLLEGIRLGRTLPQEPWTDTQPGVRRREQ